MIGIVAATGGVGTAASRQLRSWGTDRLRLGVRDPRRGAALASELGPGVEVAAVDVTDSAALRRFCDGCTVVLNCAGPAVDVGDRVASAAVEAETGYVDPAAGGDLLSGLDRLDPARRGVAAVLAAGLQPGLTGLLPRLLARRLPLVGGVVSGYIGGRDRFTVSGATDYLRGSDDFGVAFAQWRDGTRVLGLAEQAEVELPFFPERVTVRPYLSTELESFAVHVRLSEATWGNVLAGKHLRDALGRTAALSRSDPGAAAAELRAAAELDLFGRSPYHVVLVEAVAPDGSAASVMVRGTGATELTGAVAALTTRAVESGDVPPGLHQAADVMDPDAVLTLLRTADAVTAVEYLDGPARLDEEEL